MVKISSLLSGLALSSGVFGYANPKACSGVCNNAHDPSIIRRSDGTYFRFSTGGRIAIHTAPAIEGPWTYKGAMLPKGSAINLPGNQDLWAPDVIQIGDLYYVYYTVSAFGSQNSAIGLARSSSMDVGSWTDIGATGVRSDSSKPYNAIDSNVFKDGSTWRMYFGSWWKGLYTVPMKNTPTAAASGGGSTQLVYEPVTTAIEAPYLYKNGNYYYLFYSQGKCCGFDADRPAAGKEYKIMVCRSTSATGGFVDKNGKSCASGGGSVVLESHGWVYGPGGQGVYKDPKYGAVLYYHYVDTRIGYGDGQKKFGWNTIDFSSGWPTV
ncbi:glycosyl hydrolase [Ilyonectria sp. MPI-CAGE-AT-0026]|nr:glycosyl hydrolase [Ilyonectria sp. MPI-CAGE-AT-0026]